MNHSEIVFASCSGSMVTKSMANGNCRLVDSVQILWTPAEENLPTMGARMLVDVTDGGAPSMRIKDESGRVRVAWVVPCTEE